MSVNPIDGAVGIAYDAKTDPKTGKVTVTYQGKTTTYKNYKEFVELFKKDYDAKHPPFDQKGTTVESNPNNKELTEEQKAAKAEAKQAELDEIAQAKEAATKNDKVAQVAKDGVETEYGVITSHGKGTAYTFDIKAPEKEKQKTTKAAEQARMARYFDEKSGEWIEVKDGKTIKEVRAELKAKRKELKQEIQDAKKELKADKKNGSVSLEKLKEDNIRLAQAREEYAQAKQAHKASKGRGISGDTRAFNRNVKANNRLVNREVFYDKADAKAAKKDAEFAGKTIKVASENDIAVLRQLSATAQMHYEESSSPNEKALWGELANLFKDENGKEVDIKNVDTKKIQDALIDLTGGDMRLNYTEQQIIAKETGMSMSQVRHAFKTYGFEAPHPMGKRLVNGLVAAAPVAASMGLGYLLSKSKSSSKAHAESTVEDHAISDAHQTTVENGEVTATAHAHAETEGFKFDWIDPDTGAEIHRRFSGQVDDVIESVTEYYEAIAQADAHAEAHAKAFASADAACTAVAALKPAVLAAAPAIAFLAGMCKTPVEINAAKRGVTTQKMATYVEAFRKNKNKNIGNQIIQMAGQITGDKAVDRALIVAVLDHDIGSQNTTPRTRELRNALAHLDAIKAEVDKFKKLPPKEEPTPAPTEAPTECPVDLYETPNTYIHKRKAGDTWTGLVKAYYPDCLNGKHSISECIRELKKQLAYDDDGNFHQDLYTSLLKGHDIPKELKMPEMIFDSPINKDAKVKAEKIVHGKGRGPVLDKAGRTYYHASKQDCKDNEPTNAPEGTRVHTGGKTFEVVNGKWQQK